METKRQSEISTSAKPRYKNVYEKLHNVRTISNLKKCQLVENEITGDRLDHILSSTYNHCIELFPDTEDVFIQNETKNEGVWGPFGFIFRQKVLEENNLGHPIKYGGISERRSPHNIKLINSSHHSLKTLPGFSRSFGGTVYYY